MIFSAQVGNPDSGTEFTATAFRKNCTYGMYSASFYIKKFKYENIKLKNECEAGHA
jgi:hypothetical protein